MLRYFYNVNPYVEAQPKYGSESVKLELDEAAKRITVYAVDVYNEVIAGANPLVDETYATLESAIKAYNDLEHQLAQGDIIRAIPGDRKLRDAYVDNQNSRF
ncbi:hypothetical protein D1872_51890 [compost metagenome]